MANKSSKKVMVEAVRTNTRRRPGSGKKEYRVPIVVASLSKKNDCRVYNNVITILTDKVYNKERKQMESNPNKQHDLGNGSLGKIDYLLKQGYVINHVDTFFKEFNSSRFNDTKAMTS